MSRSTAKEQPADMNDITVLVTTSYNTSYLPLPVLVVDSIPCPDSDRCDATGVPVPPMDLHRDGRSLSSGSSKR